MAASMPDGSRMVPIISFVELCFQINMSAESYYLIPWSKGQTSIKESQHHWKKKECGGKAESVLRNSPGSEITVGSLLGGSCTQCEDCTLLTRFSHYAHMDHIGMGHQT